MFRISRERIKRDKEREGGGRARVEKEHRKKKRDKMQEREGDTIPNYVPYLWLK